MNNTETNNSTNNERDESAEQITPEVESLEQEEVAEVKTVRHDVKDDLEPAPIVAQATEPVAEDVVPETTEDTATRNNTIREEVLAGASGAIASIGEVMKPTDETPHLDELVELAKNSRGAIATAGIGGLLLAA